MKKPKMIYIKWRDSFALTDGWGKTDYDKSFDPTCETTGFYMGENKTHYIVALNIYCVPKDKRLDSSDSIMIPKGCVVKKKYLKL